MQLDRVRSMRRYIPPKGIAGFERSLVRGINLSPLPPAMIKAKQFFIKRPHFDNMKID